MTRVSRRVFVCGVGCLGASTAGLAMLSSACRVLLSEDKPTRLARLGLLSSEFANSPWHTALWDGLRDLGWVQGQNLTVEGRYAEERVERLPELAAELVGLPVDVIVTELTTDALAARQATSSIPIVTTSGDPIGAGLVASLARPGGNVTGISLQGVSAGGAKLVELLMDLVPRLAHLGVIMPVDNPSANLALASIQGTAQPRGVEVQPLYVRSADDLDVVFQKARRWPADGLILRGDLLYLSQLDRVVDLAAQSRVPIVYPYREFVAAGGLFGLRTSFSGNVRRLAPYVDKILKGTKPADLPVEQLDTFEIVVNASTAKALGLTIPPDLAAQVTEWIQ